MRTIQTQVQINGDRILSVPLPKDIAEGTYQVVIIMNSQPDPDDTPDEIVIIVPNHSEIAKGTLRAIIRDIELSVEEFIELL